MEEKKEEGFRPIGLGETIFRERYARSEDETWEEASRRVAKHVAAGEEDNKIKWAEDIFYQEIVNNRFMPGGRIWYGSGRKVAQLLNCFVLPIGDSREGWGQMLYDTTVVSGTGGGIGINYSDVRPRGSFIQGTGGVATGAVSAMKMQNGIAEELRQGGGRRAALMQCLDINHPDIPEFLEVKLDRNELNNANISVALNMPAEEFIKLVKTEGEIQFEFNGLPTGGSINAAELWEKIVKHSWESGEPGVLNLHLANQLNSIAYYAKMTSTNPSMPAGVLVGTRDGIFPIEELEGKKFQVKSPDGQWSDAECWLSGKDQEVLEIDFGGGRKTYSTKQHRWPVEDEEGNIIKKYAKELKPGDLIPLNLNELTGMEGDLSLTEEEGFFLGWLMGDGWVSTRSTNGKKVMGLVFGQDERYIAERILTWMNANKARPSTISERDGCFYIQSTGQKFISMIEERYGYVGKEHIPTRVWRSNDNFIKGFIDGLFSADGHVPQEDAKLKKITLVSNRPTLLEEVSKLLSFYGISSTISVSETIASFPNGKDYDRTYTRGGLYIGQNLSKNFANTFSLSHAEKSRKLKAMIGEEIRPHRNTRVLEIKGVTPHSKQDVWDISVHHNSHVFPSQYAYTGNCGELFLPPYDCCCLGSIVLPRFVKDGEFDWEQFDQTVRVAIRFLDNVLTVNDFPLPQIREACHTNRRLGAGVTGLHTMLLDLGLEYDSEEGFAFVDKLFETYKNTAYDESATLAAEKGPFPGYSPEFLKSGFVKTLKRGIRNKIRHHGIRNCALMTIAPTGTTTMVCNSISTGIEPLFAGVYWRRWRKTDENGYDTFDRELVVTDEYKRYGKLVRGAYDIAVKDHFEMQKIAQKHVDNAISKCVAEGTLIPTDKGLIRIEDFGIAEEGEFGTLSDDYKVIGADGKSHKVTNFYNNGVVDTVKVRVDTGATIEGSEQHKVLTLDGWKLLGDLTPSDRIVGIYESFETEGGKSVNNDFNIRTNGNTLSFPSEMSDDLALFLGMMAADGHTMESTGHVGITEKCLDNNVELTFKSLVEKLFPGAEVKSTVDNRNGVRYHTVTSRALVRFVESLIGRRSRDKHVPDQILAGSMSEKLAFMSGVTLDGYTHSEGVYLYSGVGESLARGVEAIARSIGVPSVYFYEWVSRDGYKTYSVKVGNELATMISPLESHKQVSSDFIGSSWVVLITNDVRAQIDSLKLPTSHPEYSNLRYLKSSNTVVCKNTTLDKLGINYNERYYVTRVKAISSGQAHTYDIEVEDEHSYLVNGLISHNTINLPEDFSLEELSDVWLEYLPYLKGTTIYRAGSRGEEPLVAVPVEDAERVIADNQKVSEASYEELNSMDCPDGSCAI